MKHFIFLSLLVCLISCQSAKQTSHYQSSWSKYFQKNPNKPPDNFVVMTQNYLNNSATSRKTIIDLGSGAGNNLKGFLKEDYTVFAYDSDPYSIALIGNLQTHPNQLKIIQSSFEDIKTLPKNDTVIAWRSLSFMKKNQLMDFWQKINASLKNDGYFVGTFFGTNHYLKRSKTSRHVTRLTKNEIMSMFNEYQILHFVEVLQYDEKTSKCRGSEQFEHIYKIIARKKVHVH